MDINLLDGTKLKWLKLKVKYLLVRYNIYSLKHEVLETNKSVCNLRNFFKVLILFYTFHIFRTTII